ncbi:fasciclin domain-containing protein [Rhodobacteraceae bacterium ASV31]|nr:fasciclin domain-containing protein [Anianabacter salinae]
MKRTLVSGATAFALSAGLANAAAHEAANPMVGGAEMFADRNIIENAVNSPIHTTLVAAVQAAGLVETLQGEGPFTVFAPTDDAFGKLPDGTVETLVMPENKDMLTEILTCHVIGAAAMSDAIGGMIADDNGAHPVETLGGCTLTARMDGDMITLTDEQGNVATVTTADVKQSNGVIHVIDTVMLPAAEEAPMEEAAMDSDMSDEEMAMVDDVPRVGGAPMFPSRTIVENAVNSADHTTLVAAVQAAGLVDVLSSEGPFTVFAPVNAAFDALPAGTVETLLQPENKDTLTKVLTAHVVAGTLTADEIRRQERASRDGFYHLTTISGDALSARVVSSGNIYIYDESGNAYVLTQTDVMQSNGVIHVIEGVLLPK